MERSIVDVARLTGTTSRTLRHYGDIGLLVPTRIGSNGYRYYDDDSLVRLQRVLLLRQLGLGLPLIGNVLAGERDDGQALRIHLELLQGERDRLARQIASVESTLQKLDEGDGLMAEEMFDGFDHTAYRDEVTDRWGADAYKKSDAWWRSKSKDEQRLYQDQHLGVAADYQSARDAGESADSAIVQAIVARHVVWLNLAAEVTGGEITATRLRGYGDMYVSDPRFAKNYGGISGAEFVRAAFDHYAGHSL
ncbi:MAG TPA: TipAS antibiotic-recognition domain-containing protein [Galbitalea sp.]|jgi:DNA-binding transcriptional MerR regulator|nr:TipAS antibiotic-recognition domain-containing protein [Galbitalea sp.]